MKTTRMLLALFVVLTGISTLAFASTADIRSTQNGAVAGIPGKYNTIKFLGIPYAEPPIGEMRWKAPRDPQTWSGVLNANKMKSACPQKGNFFANVPSSEFGKPVGNEDCLYLNVWTPEKPSPVKRPVVLWIHGGSNFKGTSRDPMYEGAYMAAHDDVVFVSINYRLGLFGAFTHKAFQNVGSKGDRSGNFTTLDLIQGLKWVKANADQFGGDKNNITIMGHSAGCMNVWGLLQSPLAENLFDKAVCSAGIPNSYPQFMVEERSQDFINKLVIKAGLANNKSDAESFLDNQDATWVRSFLQEQSTEDIVEASDYLIPYQHINDGYVFPHGLEGLLVGNYTKVPLIIGSTTDEGTYMVGAKMLKPNEVELWEMIQNPPSNHPLTMYDLLNTNYVTYKATTLYASEALSLSFFNLFNSLKVFQWGQVWRYSFDWKETPSPWHEVFGAVHGMDAIFYLGNFVTQEESFSRFAWTPENKESRERLRSEMSTYFKGFFWTGDPNAYITDDDKKWDHSITFK
jgi:para-nitrobenzyl esterase